MIRSYYIVTASISALGVASNFLLMYLSIRCSSSKADYKYFVFFSAFQDLIFAAGFTLISPMASTRNFTFVFANTGPAGVWPYGMIIMVFFCITTITSVLFVANNFLYRYLSLCKTRLFQMLVSKEFLAVAILINTVFVANWMCMIYFSLWPYDGFIKISQELWSKNEVDIENRTYIAISNRDGTDPLKMGILIESLALLMFIAQISPACAMQIHRTLKQNSFSETTKKLHRQTLVLLSIQTVCPTVFMHLPLTLMYILLFTGANSPVVMSYIIGTLMASNPLFAPIITIAFVKNYRNYVLFKLRLMDQPRESTAPLTTTHKQVTITNKISPYSVFTTMYRRISSAVGLYLQSVRNAATSTRAEQQDTKGIVVGS